MLTPTGVKPSERHACGRKLMRQAGKQVFLAAQGGHVFAIANRCLHEGDPLREDTLGADCVLTRNWHNWKFDLASSEKLIDRGPVRTDPVAERDGEILIDRSDPPAERQWTARCRGLYAALVNNDRTRMACEVAWLQRSDFDAQVALAHALRIRN